MPGSANIHIGTSGWQYDHWTGPFYPEDISQDDFLADYSERFQTVEINNSFYRVPEKKTLSRWGQKVPEGSYSFKSRFEDGPGTNPEELIGAAHAGCFSMALSLFLEKAGYPPDHIKTEAKVHIDKQGEGFKITTIELATAAKVPGIEDKAFQEQAKAAKENCPVSQALAGTQIKLEARLIR